MLYDLAGARLTPVHTTRFRDEAILERQHLQAAIRDHIEVLGNDLLVVAEEFGEFEDANRRIDLLCVDRSARLVVVELKRTDDGSYMELQALRYAAMVSVMTFAELVQTYARHLRATGSEDSDIESAQAALMDWVEDSDDDEPLIGREVRLILVSAGFSPEVTTTVLWLNEFYGLDIRCIRLSPYKYDGRVLLDVQQVIPLPEAAELTVRLKRREAAVKKAAAENTKDYTKFVITSPRRTTPPLPKRKAMLEMVQELHAAGIDCPTIANVLPARKFRAIEGTASGDDVWPALVTAHGLNPDQDRRWYLQAPFHENGQTWVLNNNWGLGTEEYLASLAELAGGSVKVEAQTVTDSHRLVDGLGPCRRAASMRGGSRSGYPSPR